MCFEIVAASKMWPNNTYLLRNIAKHNHDYFIESLKLYSVLGEIHAPDARFNCLTGVFESQDI